MQEPVLIKSRECGHAILDHLDVGSPAAKKIREQLQNTNQRWDDLMNKLADREHNLDAAIGATKDFQDSLNRLQDRLQHIGDEFDHLSEAGSDVEDQLRKLIVSISFLVSFVVFYVICLKFMLVVLMLKQNAIYNI